MNRVQPSQYPDFRKRFDTETCYHNHYIYTNPIKRYLTISQFGLSLLRHDLYVFSLNQNTLNPFTNGPMPAMYRISLGELRYTDSTDIQLYHATRACNTITSMSFLMSVRYMFSSVSLTPLVSHPLSIYRESPLGQNWVIYTSLRLCGGRANCKTQLADIKFATNLQQFMYILSRTMSEWN
jgi:hypothetical protein